VDELTREFLIESQEGLDRMERCLTDLEERPQETALLAEIFRSVHTIKGTTGFLGYTRLEKLAHSGENLLGLLRDGKLTADRATINGLLALLDGLRAILHLIENEGNEGDGQDKELIELLNALQNPKQASAGPVVTAPAAKVEPPKAEPKPEPKAAEVQPAVEKVQEAGASTPEALLAAQEAESSASKAKAAGAGAAAASTAESTLRVDVTLLNRMMNLVGELVLTRNQILQATSTDPNLTLLSRRLDMVTADLREAVMKARMQPVSHVFSKFPRVVRDLAQILGRKVKLQLEGQETELDKSLLEAIKDPLTHAVRNSLDHGIEPPDVREANGKDPEGTLKLRAFQEGSHVIIEVSDDGAGISGEKVRNKAIERGLITAERGAQMGERDLLQLIFLPGFSTAAAVTKVSGRGVGMDVVRTNVEKIGGKVEIDSRPGKGTTLRLRIPLTLAIVPALIVRSHKQSFALPQGALSELVHLSAEQAATAIEWIDNAPLYRLRGMLLPLVFLEGLLKQRTSEESGDRDRYIAVLDADGRRFGLVVDGLDDPEEIVVKPLSAVLKNIGLYSGATVLGNGDLALILDPGAIASRAGIGLSSVEEERVNEEQDDDLMKGSEFLLVESASQQAAIPLGDVLRIERIPLSKIEYIGSRPVLNFDGSILPVDDLGGVLMSGASQDEVQLTVVVCRDGSRHVGVAVAQVLDVAAGKDLIEAGTDIRAGGVTLLKDRVTGVVDLGTIPPLPIGETGIGSESLDREMESLA
jgi:two-component system, chemotaxis family, sensor kinase CheA